MATHDASLSRTVGWSHPVAGKDIAVLRADFATRRSNNVRFGSALILLILIGMTVGAFWMVRAIRLPLDQANRLAARIAKPHLSQDIISNRSDEFGEVMQ